MDLLIKNMEMPKDGTLRLIIFPNGRVDEINIYNEACMSTDAQAVALPPHGDLIDRGELPISGSAYHAEVDLEDVLNAPVIVEATE